MDNNDAILEMYIFEANELLEKLDDILLQAEERKEFDGNCINEIFRIMHTIKGSSAMMSFNSLTEVAHKIEDLFFYVRENGIQPEYSEQLVNLTFKFTDFIRSEVINIEEGRGLETNIQPYEDNIKAFLDLISGKTTDEVKNDKFSKVIKVEFEDDLGMENLRAFYIVNRLNKKGVNFTYKPEDIKTDDGSAQEIVSDGFYLYFTDESGFEEGLKDVQHDSNIKTYEVIDLTDNIDDKKVGAKQDTKVTKTVTREVKNTEKVAEANSEVKIEKITANILNEIKEEVRNAPTSSRSDSLSKTLKQDLITVSLSKLDNLMDLMGEIVISESVIESNKEITELNSDEVNKNTRELRKLTDEMQDIVMSLRLVPVSGVFQKMKRIIRDMSKELNKDVGLILVGEDVEVDKTIVDVIQDPIMHLVRNSMDHGIETKEDRLNRRKSTKGTITLSAFNTGGEIQIIVEDDGQGFDTKTILAKAKKRGLINKPEGEYSRKEIYQLVMLPGFSTNDSVTEFSGRGVGMDVVKYNVEKVGGNVVLDSKDGVGTKITFKIPLTLTIVAGLQVTVGDTDFIIPIKNIKQSFIADNNKTISIIEGKEMIYMRGKFYPIIKIHEKFGITPKAKSIRDGILVLVEYGDNEVCLFVDDIVGEQQAVVKPVPALYNKYKLKESGIAGCSVLGDGNINVVLDIESLIESL